MFPWDIEVDGAVSLNHERCDKVSECAGSSFLAISVPSNYYLQR